MILTQHPGLLILFLAQAVCAVFFGFDTLSDLMGWDAASPANDSDLFEYLISGVLIVSVLFTGAQMINMAKREKYLSQQLGIASGAFSDLMEKQFADWRLTTSEAEVAVMAIKGFSMAEIAQMRDTKEGTVKAQCASVYRKAGVAGRHQLLSFFIEELLADGGPLPNK